MKNNWWKIVTLSLIINGQLFCQPTDFKLRSALLDSLTIEYNAASNGNNVAQNRSDNSIIVIEVEELSDTVVLKFRRGVDVMTILKKGSLLNKGYIFSFYKINELRCFIVMDKMEGAIPQNDEALMEFIRLNFPHAYEAIYEPKMDTIIMEDGSRFITNGYLEIVRLGKSYFWRVSICNGKVVKKIEIIG